MEIRYRIYNNTLYILLNGELDENTASYTRTKIDAILETNSKFNEVVLDLSEMQFMDSTGVGVLIGRYKKIKQLNKKIFISHPSRQAEKIFKMAGLYDIMPKIC